MSGADYVKSMAFGAGAGVLSSFGGPLAAAALSGLNNIIDQILLSNNSPCSNGIDWGQAGTATAAGLFTGGMGKVGSKMGQNIISIPNQIGKGVGSKASRVINYNGIGGISGELGGTY